MVKRLRRSYPNRHKALAKRQPAALPHHTSSEALRTTNDRRCVATTPHNRSKRNKPTPSALCSTLSKGCGSQDKREPTPHASPPTAIVSSRTHLGKVLDLFHAARVQPAAGSEISGRAALPLDSLGPRSQVLAGVVEDPVPLPPRL